VWPVGSRSYIGKKFKDRKGEKGRRGRGGERKGRGNISKPLPRSSKAKYATASVYVICMILVPSHVS
jgi:hypothetical protein